MHALIDIEHAEASRFDDIASTLRKAVNALETAEGALYKLLDNYKPYGGKGEGAGEPLALKIEREVRHDGEYVLTNGGSKDFGEITQEIASSIGRQAGKIRLRRGVQVDGAKGNWGEKHIERPSRLRDLNNVGFSSARDFVEYTCKNFDAIYKNGRNLIVARREKRRNLLLYVELVPSKDGNFYDVKTAFPTRRVFLKNKTLLWEKSVSSVQKSEKERAPTNQFFDEESHRAKLTGISDDRIIPHPTKNASEISKKISKNYSPRLMIKKSVARQILRQERIYARTN